MIAEAFFTTPLTNTTTKRKKKENGNIQKKPVLGVVAFDFGELRDPKFGMLRISGKFPRIYSKFKRETLAEEDLKEMSAKLMKWFNPFFKYYFEGDALQELSETAFQYAAFIYPQAEIGSTQLTLATKLFFWMWISDNVVELAVSKKVSFETLNAGFRQIHQLFKNGDTKFVEVKNFPGFRVLFESLINLRAEFVQNVPNFESRIEHLCYYFKNYSNALRWYAVDHIDHKYSEETFLNFRRHDSFALGSCELLWILEGDCLPEDIFGAPSLRRLLELASSYFVYVNDLVGVKKELRNGDFDSFVMFKVIEKGKSLTQATEEVAEAMTRDLTEYLILRSTVLQEFNYDSTLTKYLEVVDAVLEGTVRFHISSKRYHAVGLSQVTE